MVFWFYGFSFYGFLFLWLYVFTVCDVPRRPRQGQSEIKTQPAFSLKVCVFQLAAFFNHCCNVPAGYAQPTCNRSCFFSRVSVFIDASLPVFFCCKHWCGNLGFFSSRRLWGCVTSAMFRELHILRVAYLRRVILAKSSTGYVACPSLRKKY